MRGEEHEVSIQLYYGDSIDLVVYEEKEKKFTSLSIPTRLCTLINFKSYINIPSCIADGNDLMKWVWDNHSLIMADDVLPKLNHFFYLVKKQIPGTFYTGVLRNLGELTLPFCNLSLNGEPMWARGISTVFAELGAKLHPVNVNISNSLAKEWLLITRAVDLHNQGYHIEAFIVGFSLFDDMVQEFIKSRLPNLEPKEAGKLLRKIERFRLKTFLGPLLKLVIGVSAFDEIKSLKKDIEFLNEKRNSILHAGQDCTRQESQRGLRIVLEILKFLSEKGGGYTLPDELGFWSSG